MFSFHEYNSKEINLFHVENNQTGSANLNDI
jgi:hypothetical protein